MIAVASGAVEGFVLLFVCTAVFVVGGVREAREDRARRETQRETGF